jgi:hypothetical protein
MPDAKQARAFLGNGKPLTSDYRPSAIGLPGLWLDQRGWFTWFDVERMRRDPRIRLGLRILRAPIHTVTWEVEGDPEQAEFADRTLRLIWDRHISKALRILEYGIAGGELVYRYDPETDQIELADVLDRNPFDLTPLKLDGKLAGLRVKGVRGEQTVGGPVDLCGPRYWWLTNEPEFGSYYGRSRLSGAWVPWMEKVGRHGALDIRRLWYVKNAFRGGKMRHPSGETEVASGAYMTNQDYAREIAEKVETGGIMVLPNVTDEQGKYLWDYEEPKINGELRDVRDYPKDLDKEMMDGMEIPVEVIEAASSGSGWSGRSVPFLVYLTGEDQIVDTVIRGFDEQCIRPLVGVNFGTPAYRIKAKSLVPKDEEKAPGKPTPAAAEPTPNPTPALPPNANPQPVRMSAVHAPKGGATVAGQKFEGGQFIPGDVLAKATPEERAKLESKGGSAAPKSGRVPEQKPNAKAARAKASHVMVDKSIQRYAEEYNEPRFAKVIGGRSFPDSEPMDVGIEGKGGKLAHLIEMKTLVANTNAKITMDSYSQVRKIVKEQEEGGMFHTVVSDDTKVYNAAGEGKHEPDSARVYYYRRGVAGSARIGSLYRCKDEAELKQLMKTPEEKLPPAAQRTDAKLRAGKWQAFTDQGRKGFRNSETGVEFRAKK